MREQYTANVSALQYDKSFRLRLIIACIAIASIVASIYVVVSYRLSSDMAVEIELNALSQEAELFHGALVYHSVSGQKNIDEIAHQIFINRKSNEQLIVQVFSDELIWNYNQKLDDKQINSLLEHISKDPADTQGLFEIGNRQYLWLAYQGETYRIVLSQSTVSLDASLKYVAKRLSITTFICFWIAVWSALTLSSIIAKRVEVKNDELTKLATHDALTGLPNRLFLVEMMSAALPGDLNNLNQKSAVVGSLFVIDLDKFKEVNDSFGHAAGDQLLIEVSKRLSSIIASDQTLVRTGGDEFLIWAPNVVGFEAERLAKNLVVESDKPVLINKLAVNTGASIGIAYYPDHAHDVQALMTNADTAMYSAKNMRSGWSVYDEVSTADSKQRLKLRADLGNALAQKQLIFHFQPKVNIATGNIIGVEALSRWQHPTDGLLYPDQFIDLIEHSGRVQEFGRYIIAMAIERLATWQNQGVHLPIAINLSPYNLLDPELVNFIKSLLRSYNVSPGQLEVELTENETTLHVQHIEQRLSELKALGVIISIDDFGTGMSSLSYISNLEVDIIKIDRSFIMDMEVNSKHRAIASTVITLANAFGAKLVAEGIENQAQADMLVAMGCEYGQGYLYSRAIPENQLFELVQSSQTLPLSTVQKP